MDEMRIDENLLNDFATITSSQRKDSFVTYQDASQKLQIRKQDIDLPRVYIMCIHIYICI